MIHGGGFVIGSVDVEHGRGPDRDQHRRRRGVRRLPPGAGVSLPGRPADCYAALTYLHGEAEELGVDPDRVALAGTSAGGGLAAATALLARDRGGPAVCFQLLHIPELDDRLQTGSMQAFVDSPMWNRPLAEQSWRAYLGPLYGSADVPSPAAPAREPISRGCRRPTSRRPRTTRCATRGSPTPHACCRRGSRWSCTSSPAPSTGRRW